MFSHNVTKGVYSELLLLKLFTFPRDSNSEWTLWTSAEWFSFPARSNWAALFPLSAVSGAVSSCLAPLWVPSRKNRALASLVWTSLSFSFSYFILWPLKGFLLLSTISLHLCWWFFFCPAISGFFFFASGCVCVCVRGVVSVCSMYTYIYILYMCCVCWYGTCGVCGVFMVWCVCVV